MTEPASIPRESNAPVVIRIVLAVFCIIPGVIGLLLLAAIAASFVVYDFEFLSGDKPWMQAFIAGSAILIGPSVILLGIILRYARWKRAPTASLVLAIIYLLADLVGTGLFERTLEPGDTEDWQMLMFWSAVGLLVGALPPFLHWWKNSR
jgi:hypothetical protein